MDPGDIDAIRRTMDAVAAVREMIDSGLTPPPLGLWHDGYMGCEGCDYREYCIYQGGSEPEEDDL